MELVVDTNPVISALIAEGVSQDLILCEDICSVSPDWVLFEVGKHWKEVCAKTGLSETEVKASLSLLRAEITTYSLESYSDMLEEAVMISPHEKDSEFFALALKRGCPIWSQESGFKEQEKVKVYDTSELVDKFLSSAS